MPSAAAGGLAGGDVGPVHGNKRHRSEIELTTGRLAVVAGSRRAPATAHGGGRWRRSRRLGVLRCGGQIGANKRTRELAWVLRKLTTGFDGGERERWALAPAAATMAASGSGWRAGEEGKAFIRRAAHLGVTDDDGGDAGPCYGAWATRVRRRHSRRTGGPRRARAYGGADAGAPRAGARWGA
jgi:hypothetical protein